MLFGLIAMAMVFLIEQITVRAGLIQTRQIMIEMAWVILVILMLIMMVALGAIILGSGIKTIQTDAPPVDFRTIGEDFLTYYWPALVLMALILASSVIGALTLARREDMENEQRTN